jgi:hypothetical protein
MQAQASSKASYASSHFRRQRLLFEYNTASSGSSLIACTKTDVKDKKTYPAITESN